MKTKRLLLCALLCALTVIGAMIRIPFGYAIITMQFLFAALAGVLLGAKWGAASQLLYLLLGFAGLPVFGGGGGISYLVQPTCGFVLALPLCAALIGALVGERRSKKRIVLSCALALMLLYAVGLIYMYLVLWLWVGEDVTLLRLAALYVLPYLPGDCVKIALCAALGTRLPKEMQN
ncbi:MAG: biotin transporter BioY [Oscillospiraceae bacterium]|nr:biotin transporter BioY [Oscillospiraceae bacterium]